MLTKYINPNGQVKEAELSVEQVKALKEKGVKILASEAFSMQSTFAMVREEPFTLKDTFADFDLPEVPKVRIHRKPFEECESCQA
jgi:hypothetical protein